MCVCVHLCLCGMCAVCISVRVVCACCPVCVCVHQCACCPVCVRVRLPCVGVRVSRCVCVCVSVVCVCVCVCFFKSVHRLHCVCACVCVWVGDRDSQRDKTGRSETDERRRGQSGEISIMQTRFRVLESREPPTHIEKVHMKSCALSHIKHSASITHSFCICSGITAS